jgi:predicted N-acetyltransferase YhbS
MTIKLRPYNHEEDYNLVGNFLIETYQPGKEIINWMQTRWEYMFHHPYLFEKGLNKYLDKIGIWEDEGKIVGVANFEHHLGTVYVHINPEYHKLKAEILEYAQKNLTGISDKGKPYISVYIKDNDTEFEAIAESMGFEKGDQYLEAMSQYQIPEIFPEISLPEGFKLKSLANDNDLNKVNRVLWRGFDHQGKPNPDLTGRKLMQSAPNYRKDLNIIVEAPTGEFVSYCGMWYDPVNQVGYVEPVATDPDYRMMGLGKAAVLEGIRRCGKLGATVAYVATDKKFYLAIGFENLFDRYPWFKELK